jgi:prepilin-type processing-associated H-X9-DG protein
MEQSHYVAEDWRKSPGGWFPGWKLTAIGLTGFLLWFLFAPVMHQGRVTRTVSCISNAKQLATGLLMYAQDYDDRLPPAHSWADGLDPYTKSRSGFVCPTSKQKPSSYAYNRLLNRANLKDIADPAAQPALFESFLHGWNAASTTATFVTPHGEFGTIAFADGHARMVRSAPADDAGLMRSPIGGR